MKTTTKMVKLSTINLNPDNPRRISTVDMEKLIKSLEGFLKMLPYRPIVYDRDRIIIGGNMRFLALQKLGYKEVPESWVRCADDFTDDERRQVIITDNGSFGTWDFDALANSWGDLPLANWGIKGIDDEESLKPKLDYEEKELRPYRMSHVLLSFPPEKLLEIQKHLEKIIKTEGVEYEQSSN